MKKPQRTQRAQSCQCIYSLCSSVLSVAKIKMIPLRFDLLRPALWFWGGVRFSILSAVFGFEVVMDTWVFVCGCGAPVEIFKNL